MLCRLCRWLVWPGLYCSGNRLAFPCSGPVRAGKVVGLLLNPKVCRTRFSNGAGRSLGAARNACHMVHSLPCRPGAFLHRGWGRPVPATAIWSQLEQPSATSNSVVSMQIDAITEPHRGCLMVAPGSPGLSRADSHSVVAPQALEEGQNGGEDSDIDSEISSDHSSSDVSLARGPSAPTANVPRLVLPARRGTANPIHDEVRTARTRSGTPDDNCMEIVGFRAPSCTRSFVCLERLPCQYLMGCRLP